MKEATGELNMTIVTLVAITAVGALLYFVVWPMIQKMIVENTCQTYGSAYHATKGTNTVGNTGAQDAKTVEWQCCPSGKTYGDAECFKAN